MRLPAWLKTRRQRRVGQAVVVDLELDPYRAELAERIRELGRATGVPMATLVAGAGAFGSTVRAAAEAERAMGKLQAAMSAEVADGMVAFVHREVRRLEVRQAGLEARYYVRGAMDPTYATPEARDACVRALLAYAANGPEKAAAFLRGWVEHHPEPVCECPPCPGRGNDGHGMTHCAECCFGMGVEADLDCPVHGVGSGVR